MKYLITEYVTFQVEADSEEDALEKFLNNPDPDFIDVIDRTITPIDPEVAKQADAA